MFAWLRRALTPVEPAPPRLSARVTQLENDYEDILSRLDQLQGELRRIRGRQFAMEKSAQDDPGPTNGDEQPVDQPRLTPPTAHLARRFRGF